MGYDYGLRLWAIFFECYNISYFLETFSSCVAILGCDYGLQFLATILGYDSGLRFLVTILGYDSWLQFWATIMGATYLFEFVSDIL